MEVEQLPLQELFTRLRRAGLSLGIDEYKLLLAAIRGGFGLQDRAALARLCCTLWVKSPQEKRIFDYHFAQVIGKPDALVTDWNSAEVDLEPRKRKKTWFYIVWGGIVLVGLSLLAIAYMVRSQRNQEEVTQPTEIAQPTPIETAQPTDTPTLIAIPNLVSITSPIFWVGLFGILLTCIAVALLWRKSNRKVAQANENYDWQFAELTESENATENPIAVTQEIDEIAIAQLIQGANSFLITNEVFPITSRQMKQSWRYLRRFVRSGKPTELDIQATVNHISRQGMLLEPVFVPRRVNRTQVLLLIDRDGSMVPFHPLSHRLVQTAMQGRLGQTSIYYFHNCPLEYLYRDPNHQQAALISQILTPLDKNWTVAMIFSDAGALRGGFSPQRIQLTLDFLARLQPRVRYLAWLNPIPNERWQGTTAGEIARLVPMFGINRSEFQQAIDFLRGKSYEGRRK